MKIGFENRFVKPRTVFVTIRQVARMSTGMNFLKINKYEEY